MTKGSEAHTIGPILRGQGLAGKAAASGRSLPLQQLFPRSKGGCEGVSPALS